MKHIVITGTRKGIGCSLAKHYLDQGWGVVGCSRSEASIEHPHYKHYCLNIGEEAAVVEMARAVRQQRADAGDK